MIFDTPTAEISVANETATTFKLPQLNINGAKVVADLQWLIDECEARALEEGIRWATEVATYCQEKWFQDAEKEGPLPMKEHRRLSTSGRVVEMARSLIRCKEFHRAEYHLKALREGHSPVHTFLYHWARYLGATKIRVETEAEAFDRKAQNLTEDDDELARIALDLTKLKNSNQTDAFLLYLLGRVQRDLGQLGESCVNLTHAVTLEPRLWLAWEILYTVLKQAEEVEDKRNAAKGAWMADWFALFALHRFKLFGNVTESLDRLLEGGFELQPALLAVKATALNELYDHDSALETFAELRRLEPLRVEAMNVLSDSLYIKGARSQLASLAHAFFRTHRFHWETCCIVANYYSIRRDHDQAIRFLQRAVRLNPFQVATWTLIGHEFMELKNNSAACLAYRRATEVDVNDHRGWYGLGQLYDILKMNTYSLFYYQQAHRCKPDDSRMLVALGEVYTKLNRKSDAQRCFLKAFKVGDVEGTALMRLAKLYEEEKDLEGAAQVYEKYLLVYCQDDDSSQDENAAQCAKFLARYFVDKNDLQAAEMHGQRCLLHERSREEGRAILRKIAEKNREAERPPATTEQAPQRSHDDSTMSVEMATSDDDAELSFE